MNNISSFRFSLAKKLAFTFCTAALLIGSVTSAQAQMTNGWVDVDLVETVISPKTKFIPPQASRPEYPSKLDIKLKILISGQPVLKDTLVAWETPTTKYEFTSTNVPYPFKVEVVDQAAMTAKARIIVNGNLKITSISTGRVTLIKGAIFDDVAIGTWNLFDAFGIGSHHFKIYSKTSGNLQVITNYIMTGIPYKVGPNTYNLVSP